MRATALARIVLAGALACLLSACWTSEKPLVTGKAASAAAVAGFYRGERGEDEGPLELEIVATGPTSYAMVSDKDERIPVRFLALKGDWYLMQFEAGSDEEGGKGGYMYEPVKLVGGDLNFYAPDCGDVPGKFKGLTRDDKMIPTCTFTRLDGLKAMALAYVAKVERGEIAAEPNVLKRISR